MANRYDKDHKHAKSKPLLSTLITTNVKIVYVGNIISFLATLKAHLYHTIYNLLYSRLTQTLDSNIEYKSITHTPFAI